MQIPIESFNLQMLNVGLAHHNGDWNWQNVQSPFTRIFYVKEGEAQVHLPDKVVPLRSGYLYIIPAYTLHSYECHSTFTHYYLHVYEGFNSEMNIVELYDFPTEVAAISDDEMILQRMCAEHPMACLPESNPQAYDNVTQFTDYVTRYRDMSLWHKMELRGAILMLFSRFIREAKPRLWTNDDRMKRVLDYMHSHLTQDIDVDELANVACVTKTYLIKIFKQQFGTSPIQYFNNKKIERAQLLLYTTDLPIKEVAYKLGFNDHSYFIRLFHKLSGFTPLEYRKMNIKQS